MAFQFPYIHIRCPCTDVSTPSIGEYKSSEADQDDEEQETFDPKSRRANFSLYPMEHLLYCDDCYQIRCPRCTIEDVLCFYCPSCLFEVPSGVVQSDGSRCTRNCFNCPVCTAPMTVNPLDVQNTNVPTGPFILACGFCNWTSLEIGMEFDKINNIYGQIALKHGGFPNTLSPTRRPLSSDQLSDSYPRSGPDAIYASLKSFYSSQLSASKPTNSLLTPSGEFNYNSPSSLARIMSLYTGLGTQDKKSAPKPQLIRESANPSEGLHITNPDSDAKAIQKLREQGWAGTTSTTQRNAQPQSPRFLTDVLPVPTLLRTKRNKRCRTCRHLLVLPDSKVQSTRFRLKQVALNFIPTMTLKHLPLAAGRSREIQLGDLPPFEPTQFLLTLKNPLYEAIRITLATPPHTPGPHAHRVTILCPQFDVGRNTDLWDDALNGGGSKGDDKERPSAHRSSQQSSKTKAHESILGSGPEGKVAEAGKVWDQGRNWTSVVLEVVCAVVGGGAPGHLTEDEDVVEIPVFVRVEWQANLLKDEAAQEQEKVRERRELAYWAVIGVGKVGSRRGVGC